MLEDANRVENGEEILAPGHHTTMFSTFSWDEAEED